MVRKPRKNHAWVAFGVLATFLLAALAPLATAEPDERPRPERAPRERPDHRERPERDYRAFKIELNGTAVTKDNETYQIVLVGEGRARTHGRDGNVTDAKGVVRLKAQLIDADGNVVKEGVIKARFHAHDGDDGWKWKLVGIGKNKRGFPSIVLRGTAVAGEAALFDLEGHGRAVVKFPDEDHRTPLKLDVAGTLTRA